MALTDSELFWILYKDHGLQTFIFQSTVVSLCASGEPWWSSEVPVSLVLISLFKAVRHSIVCDCEQQVQVTMCFLCARLCSPLTVQCVMEASSHVPLNH